jgi:hypothetical protein
VELLAHLKATLPDATNCPVVAFGGSYGGTLTTFLRASYPAAVVGGLASSAPIGYYDRDQWAAHGVSEFTFMDIINRVYDEADPQCTVALLAAIDAINMDPSAAMTAFHVCERAGLGPHQPSELFQVYTSIRSHTLTHTQTHTYTHTYTHTHTHTHTCTCTYVHKHIQFSSVCVGRVAAAELPVRHREATCLACQRASFSRTQAHATRLTH